MKWNLYREVPLCWENKTSEHTRGEKSTASKDCDQKEMIAFDCICLSRTIYVLQDINPSKKQIGHFMGRETVYYNLNSNMVEGVDCTGLAAR